MEVDMANVNFTADSGSVKNVFTQDVDLVFIRDAALAASTGTDSVTLTDVKKILWAVPCVVDTSTLDVYAGTAFGNYVDDPGRLYIEAGSVGTAYILAVIQRARS